MFSDQQKRYIEKHLDDQTPGEMAQRLQVKRRYVQRYILKLKKQQHFFQKSTIETSITPSIKQPEKSSQPSKSAQHFWQRLMIFVLIALGWLAYQNTLRHEFVWDDVNLVEKNRLIRSWTYFPQIFFENLGVGIIQDKSSSYRPLQTITYLIDHTLWGLTPGGFHLTNMLLHIVVGVLLFQIIMVLFDRRFWAFLTAALWLVHPIHTEAVTYVSGRADPLSALFILLGYLQFVQIRQSQSWVRWVIFFFSVILAVLSRESALVIMPIFLVVDALITRHWKTFIPAISITIGISIVYVALRKLEILGAIRPLSAYTPPVWERLPGFFSAFGQYLRLMFWPVDLHMEYGRPLIPWSRPDVWLGLFLLIMIVSALFHLRRSHQVFRWGGVLFLGTLLPVANVIYPVNAYMAEHWLYIPSMGVAVIVAYGLAELWKRQPGLSGVLSCGLVLILSVLTFHQNKHWQNSIRFYEYTRQYAPGSARLHADLGVAYFQAGRKDDALQSFQQAIRLYPNYAFAYNNMGVVLNQMGRHEEATRVLQKALSLQNNYAAAHFNLGNALKATKRFAEAEKEFRQTIAVDPNYADAYNNLGLVLKHLKRMDEAIAAYRQGLALQPNNVKMMNNLGSAYNDVGAFDVALKLYARALEMPMAKKNQAIIFNNKGIAQVGLQQWSNALQSFQRALEIHPDFIQPYYRIADIYKKNGQMDLADSFIKRAKERQAQR